MSRQQPSRRAPSTMSLESSKSRNSEPRLSEFLNEFSNQSDSSPDSKPFYQNFCNNQDLQQTVYRVLHRVSPQETDDNDDVLHFLCCFLLKMYRSTFSQRSAKTTFIPTSTANDMLRTRVFVLQYLPHFIYLRLMLRHQPRPKICKTIDAFLLAVYNTEVIEQQSLRATANNTANMPINPLIRPAAVKVPPLASSSNYHDSSRLESEDKLDQRPSGLAFQFEISVFEEYLTASNRPKVFKVLLQTFNRHSVEISKFGLDQFVRATLKTLDSGYGQPSSPRIQLDAAVLQELLFGAYVCMYNGFQVAANQIVDIIHSRASVSGCTEVLLLSNSIKNLVLNSSPSQVSTTHVSTPNQLAKNMITNASFRAKKMQTDIPKVHVDQSLIEEGSAKDMAAIAEEDARDEEKTPAKSESSNKGFNRDKLIAKLRKKTLSISEDNRDGGNTAQIAADKKEKKDFKADKKKQKERERPDKLEMVTEITPLVSGLNGESTSAASNSSKEYDTVEKVEELIQMKRLPAETITIHSPESGTTIF